MSRIAEYRAQLAAIKAEPHFQGKKRLIKFFGDLIAEEIRPTSEPGTTNFMRLFATSSNRRQTRRSGASTKSTRRRNRNGSR